MSWSMQASWIALSRYPLPPFSLLYFLHCCLLACCDSIGCVLVGSTMYLCLYLSVYVSVWMSLCVYVCTCIYLSLLLWLCLCMSVYVSVCLPLSMWLLCVVWTPLHFVQPVRTPPTPRRRDSSARARGCMSPKLKGVRAVVSIRSSSVAV